MRDVRRAIIASLALLLTCGIAPHLAADELTMAVERDLAALGYDTGPVDGRETMETVIAISKFQAENQLEVTGEITPQLAGTLSARASGGLQDSRPITPPTAQAPLPTANPVDQEAARQACLQRKVEEAQEAQKTKRGLSRLMSAVVRTATRQGNPEVARTINEVHATNATVEDLTAAARDLGLTESDLAGCDTAGVQP